MSMETDRPSRIPRRLRQIGARRLLLLAGAALIVFLAAVLLFALVNPPITPYQWSEQRRLGSIAHEWVPMEDIAPIMARAVVAAEDARFCAHYGLDFAAIQDVLGNGGGRGASTISQQVVKNVYLWHGRSWLRKGLEAGITPVVELLWTKRRILEVYLNVAEFDAGVFGVGAAAEHYFGVPADRLSVSQATRLAAVLPDPKRRSPLRVTRFMRERAAAIAHGAATLVADGRSTCFASARH